MTAPQRDEVLPKLSTSVRTLESNLQNILQSNAAKSKWKWPAEAMGFVQEMRKLGEDVNVKLREELDRLLLWPNEELVNPKYFYGTDPPFDRNEDWFENVMGFNKYETCYTFTDSWDKVELMATFLVPDNLKPGDKCPVVWNFHGGGFVSDSC